MSVWGIRSSARVTLHVPVAGSICVSSSTCRRNGGGNGKTCCRGNRKTSRVHCLANPAHRWGRRGVGSYSPWLAGGIVECGGYRLYLVQRLVRVLLISLGNGRHGRVTANWWLLPRVLPLVHSGVHSRVHSGVHSGVLTAVTSAGS